MRECGVRDSNPRTPARRDLYPEDILRGYLAASTVRLLDFDDTGRWADAIMAEVDRGLEKVVLGWTEVSTDDTKASCEIVAEILVRLRMRNLDHYSLGKVQD